jgi:branched-chain amino acid transport system ATP-binding protein
MDTVMNALAERGVTTIFIEHDMEIVERYARRGVAFAGGRIIADGDVSAVLAEPEVRRSVLGVD